MGHGGMGKGDRISPSFPSLPISLQLPKVPQESLLPILKKMAKF